MGLELKITEFNELEDLDDAIEMLTAIYNHLDKKRGRPAEEVVPVDPTPPPVVMDVLSGVVPTPPPVVMDVLSGAVPTPPPATDPPVDAEGLPWDGRIHSAGKTLLKVGGVWKMKRGVSSTVIEKVKSGLLATQSAPTATVSSYEVPTPPVETKTVDYPELMRRFNELGWDTSRINAFAVEYGLESIMYAAVDDVLLQKMYNDPKLNN